MPQLREGDAAPDFTAVNQQGERVSLNDFRGRAVVLFFYPADNSPVCTKEACSFRDAYEDFVEAGAVVMGVSGDGAETHQQFSARHGLPYTLLSDTGGTIRRLFGVPRTFGLFPGRVTYVIDAAGIVRHIFNSQFAVDRHPQEALGIVRGLKGAP